MEKEGWTFRTDAGVRDEHFFTLNGEDVDSASYNYTAETAVLSLNFALAEQFDVTFDSAGGSSEATQTVTDGEKVSKPTDPTLTGYTFGGWFKGSSATAYDFDTAVTEAFTLTAHWTANTDPPSSSNSPSGGGGYSVGSGGVVSSGSSWKPHTAYVEGYSSDWFGADDPLTRAQAATIFWRLSADGNKDVAVQSAFTDVSANEWYSQAVGYLSSVGVLNGYPDGTFRPNAYITRAEFVAVVERISGDRQGGENPYNDVADEHWAVNDILSATAKKWLSGYPGGEFRPDALINRAETVKVVNGTLDRRQFAADFAQTHVSPFADVTPEHWAFSDIVEASQTHEFELRGGAETWR